MAIIALPEQMRMVREWIMAIIALPGQMRMVREWIMAIIALPERMKMVRESGRGQGKSQSEAGMHCYQFGLAALAMPFSAARGGTQAREADRAHRLAARHSQARATSLSPRALPLGRLSRHQLGAEDKEQRREGAPLLPALHVKQQVR